MFLNSVDVLKLSLPAGGVLFGLAGMISYAVKGNVVTSVWAALAAIVALVLSIDIWKFHRSGSYHRLGSEEIGMLRTKLWFAGATPIVSVGYILYNFMSSTYEFVIWPSLCAIWSLVYLVDLWKFHGGRLRRDSEGHLPSPVRLMDAVDNASESEDEEGQFRIGEEEEEIEDLPMGVGTAVEDVIVSVSKEEDTQDEPSEPKAESPPVNAVEKEHEEEEKEQQ